MFLEGEMHLELCPCTVLDLVTVWHAGLDRSGLAGLWVCVCRSDDGGGLPVLSWCGCTVTVKSPLDSSASLTRQSSLIRPNQISVSPDTLTE